MARTDAQRERDRLYRRLRRAYEAQEALTGKKGKYSSKDWAIKGRSSAELEALANQVRAQNEEIRTRKFRIRVNGRTVWVDRESNRKYKSALVKILSEGASQSPNYSENYQAGYDYISSLSEEDFALLYYTFKEFGLARYLEIDYLKELDYISDNDDSPTEADGDEDVIPELPGTRPFDQNIEILEDLLKEFQEEIINTRTLPSKERADRVAEAMEWFLRYNPEDPGRLDR